MFGAPVSAGDGDKAKPKRNPEMLFKKLDTNNDGKLTLDEFKKLGELRKGKENGKGGGKMLDKLFQRLDADKDGTLSLAEFKKIGELRGKKGAKKTEDE